jgi:hypothetical protein
MQRWGLLWFVVSILINPNAVSLSWFQIRGLPGGIVVLLLRPCDRKKDATLQFAEGKGISKTGKFLILQVVQF